MSVSTKEASVNVVTKVRKSIESHCTYQNATQILDDLQVSSSSTNCLKMVASMAINQIDKNDLQLQGNAIVASGDYGKIPTKKESEYGNLIFDYGAFCSKGRNAIGKIPVLHNGEKKSFSSVHGKIVSSVYAMAFGKIPGTSNRGRTSEVISEFGTLDLTLSAIDEANGQRQETGIHEM